MSGQPRDERAESREQRVESKEQKMDTILQNVSRRHFIGGVSPSQQDREAIVKA